MNRRKLRRIRRSIEGGTYQVSSEAVADAILRGLKGPSIVRR